MSGMLIALALFGCSDDATYCERLSAPAQTYESRVQCEAAQESVLQTDAVMRVDYPNVISFCTAPTVLARLGDGPVDLTSPKVQMALR